MDEGGFRIDVREIFEYNVACMDEGTQKNSTEHRGAQFTHYVRRTFCTFETSGKMAKTHVPDRSIFVQRNRSLGRTEFAISQMVS